MNLETCFTHLFDIFIKSMVLLTFAALLVSILRRASAATLHGIAVSVFIVLLLLPGTKLMSPQWSLDFNQMPATSSANVRVAIAGESGISHPAMQSADAVDPMVVSWLDIPLQRIGVIIWLSGATFLFARRTWISLRLASVVRRSSPLGTGRLAAIARKVVQASGVNAEIRVSDECRVPLVSGLLQPRVLLPVEVKEWPEELIFSALQHELGHIRRRDCISRLLANFVCAIYWMNPLVWFAARRLRLYQEHACDDLVLNSGTSAEEYASQLVNVVRSLQGDRFISHHVLAMAQPSTLETRVRAIVDETRDRSPLTQRSVFTGFAFVSLALILCTTAQLCGEIENKTVQDEDKSDSTKQLDKTTLSNDGNEKKAPSATDNATALTPLISVESRFVEISEDAAHPTGSLSLPAGLESFKKTPGIINVFTDKQAQTVLRELSQKKGVDLLSAPRVITRSNQTATVEVSREFDYPPKNEESKRTGDAKPHKEKKMKVGVSLGVTAAIQPDNTLEMNLKPEVVEFEGFSKGKNGEQKPVFNERRLNVDVTILPGQTVVMGLKTRIDTQLVEDRMWFFFKKKTTRKIDRHLFVFVTARIIKPGSTKSP